MVLQHTIKYHEVGDWIHLQDQSTATYQSLLAHCREQKVRCEQFQQAQAQGKAHLRSITAASSSHFSICANAQSTTTCHNCSRCGYSHPCANCPTFGQECYNCHGTGHFTALCRRPCNTRYPTETASKLRDSRGRSHRSSSCRHSSRLPSRGRQSHRSHSSSSHRSNSSSSSSSQDHSQRRFPQRGWCILYLTGIRLAI